MTTTTTTRRGKALSLTAAGVSLVIGALVATLATTASQAGRQSLLKLRGVQLRPRLRPQV